MFARLTPRVLGSVARGLPTAAAAAFAWSAIAATAFCAPPPPHTPTSCACGPTVTTPDVIAWLRGFAGGGLGGHVRSDDSAGAYGRALAIYAELIPHDEGPLALGVLPDLQVVDLDSDKISSRSTAMAVRRSRRRVLYHAACLDDRGAPHPASQVNPEREVAETYDGEIFRCIAGTHLQATWGDYADSLKLEHGESLACDKGQALWHAPGGAVTCRTQTPARDCNERSLLRRYGVGVKVVTQVRDETAADVHEGGAEPPRLRASGGPFSLDGGVGGFH